MNIVFKWDMTDKEFKDMRSMTLEPDPNIDIYKYDGAVFFGDFKIEFCTNSHCVYTNCFQYGVDGGDCLWLADDTPYKMNCDFESMLTIPHRRTFDSFARNIEAQILKYLGEHPEYAEVAYKSTEPDKWYPNGQGYTIKDFSRIA